MFAGVEPHAQIPRCVDGIGDGTVKSDRSAEVLHHFGLGRTIGFQAAVSDTSGGKHSESRSIVIGRSWFSNVLVARYGHTIRKQRELPGERDNARNNAGCTQARKTTHGLDGQHQDVDRTPRGRVSKMTEDRDKWRKYVHGVANPWIEDG